MFADRQNELVATRNKTALERAEKPKAGIWVMSRAKKRLSDGTEKKLRNLKPFKPGQSRESERTAEDARNRLGTQFLEALEADFNRFGIQAIALVRERKPKTYMRVVADLLPKEANVNVEAGEAFVNLWRNISEGFGDELACHLDEDPSRVGH